MADPETEAAFEKEGSNALTELTQKYTAHLSELFEVYNHAGQLSQAEIRRLIAELVEISAAQK